jgi:hypothetical protein
MAWIIWLTLKDAFFVFLLALILAQMSDKNSDGNLNPYRLLLLGILLIL